MGYEDRVASGLKGLEAVSTGICSGCDKCMGIYGYETTDKVRFEEDWASGWLPEDGSFSHGACGICGSSLGGNRYMWHWIRPNDTGSVVGQPIEHESDACVDCVQYLANGTLPDED